MVEKSDKSELLALTTDIVAAHVANNRVDSGELPQLIREVFATLSGIGETEPVPERPQPAVPVKR